MKNFQSSLAAFRAACAQTEESANLRSPQIEENTEETPRTMPEKYFEPAGAITRAEIEAVMVTAQASTPAAIEKFSTVLTPEPPGPSGFDPFAPPWEEDSAPAAVAGVTDDTAPKQEPVKEQEVVLSEEQEAVIELARKGGSLLITGSAGTGKSTLLKALIQRLDGRLPVTASTGIAAVNVGGMTLHSWAGIGIAEDTPRQIAGRIITRNGEALNRIRNYNRLAIDEVSMISAELFDKLDWVFRYVRKDENRPFGGMQLIMFGDLLQLPPVIKNQRNDGEGAPRFCFQSKAWEESKVKVVMLTKVFRQADAAFSSALNSIRVGHVTAEVSALLNARFHARNTDKDILPVVVHTHNRDVDRINAEHLEKLPEKGAERYLSIDTGREAQLATLQANCLAPAVLDLRIGAQVMLLKNLDTDAGLANGSLGKVIEFTKTMRLPVVKFQNGLTRTIEQAQWDIKDDGKVMASRRQIPLRLAYAITVHKCQGLTLEKIEVHLANCFEDGQAYVALSRAKTAEGLFIASGSRASIRASAEAVEFYKNAQ